MEQEPFSKHDGRTPLDAAREAIKKGETQKAIGLLAAIRLDHMTTEEKELLVVVARAVHLEKQLASQIKEANEDSNISLVEAARILIICREYLSINPDNPKVQNLASQCRDILAKTQGDCAVADKGVLTAAIAVRYLEEPDEVDLNDFHSLTEEAAQVLSLHNSPLYLNGIASLSPESASALSRHAESLSLRGLTTLSDGVAAELARFAGDELDLGGVTALTPDVARSLARYSGKRLSLDGLEQLSNEAASCLASCKGDLSLWGVSSLSLGAAKALSQHSASLSLLALDSPSAEVWEALEAKPGLVVSDTVVSRMSPRIKALDEAANQAAPTDLLAVLWDWDRREKLTKDQYPDIPGGYGGPLERPAIVRVDIKKEGDHWHYRAGVIQLDNEFPVEELQAEAQRILDAVPQGIPVVITVENDRPGTDSECEFFWGDEQGYQEWAGEGDDADADDDAERDEGVNLSEEIRKVAKAMQADGEVPCSTTIIATLKENGIAASTGQVELILARMGVLKGEDGEEACDDEAEDEAVISTVADLIKALSGMDQASRVRVRVVLDGEVSGYMSVEKVELVDDGVEVVTYD